MLDAVKLRCAHQAEPLGLDQAEPEFSWQLQSPAKDARQTAWQIQVADVSRGFDDVLLWDSGKQAGADSLYHRYQGTSLASHQDCRWRVRVWDAADHVSEWSEVARFAIGLLAPTDWPTELRWIRHQQERLAATPMLRREFAVDAELVDARLYVACRGLVDVLIDGQPINDHFFTSGWTDYRIRTPYRCYDVTRQLSRGAHCLGCYLNDGWFAGPLAWDQKRFAYGSRLELALVLRLSYGDGRVSYVTSDADWRSRPSGIQASSFLNGERFDAQLEASDWCEVGFDATTWGPVESRPINESEQLSWHAGPPVRPIAEFPVQRWWQQRPGRWIGDIGQNIAGVVRLRIQVAAGTVIQLRFAEVLTSDKELYTDNLRSAECCDTFVAAGTGLEEWQPRFTYHGFQYIEIIGLTDKPAADTVVALALSSDCPEVGTFECNESLINTIASNAVWTQRANYLEVPTDCPQRDERLGWTGDAQAYIRTAARFHDIASFHTKWLQDLDDATTEDGRVPVVAPRVPEAVEGDADAAWADAATICPWECYQAYGDLTLLRRHYGMMKRFLSFYRRTRTPGRHVRYQLPGGRHVLADGSTVSQPTAFGDWLAVDAQTDKEILRTAFYAHSCRIVRDTARALGDVTEAEARETEWQAIRADFCKEFVSEDGRIRGRTTDSESQTGYVVALHFDLLPETLRAVAVGHLVADIKARNDHLSTGFVGLPYLLPVLSRFGHTDLAYTLLLNTSYPSWGYEIEHGATSIWERWNGYHHEDGPGDPNMNSYSHYAYGAVCEWFFTDIAGIEALEPGFKRVRIRPRTGVLRYAKANYESIRGPISCHWHREEAGLRVDVALPPGVTAELWVPAAADAELQVDGQVVSSEADRDGYQLVTVGSGKRVISVHGNPALA